MKFIDTVFEKLKRHPKRIVFPEGAEGRVLLAAERFVRQKLGIPILLGNKAAIEKAAHKQKIDLSHVRIIDPAESSDLPLFCERLEKLERYRKMGVADSRAVMLHPNYFATMMVQYGQADGVVGGASEYASALLRPLIQIIKPLPNVKTISSCMIVQVANRHFGEDGVLVFADCAVIPEPTVEQLASIAIEAGRVARQVMGLRPRVAMLSFSTKGSAVTPGTEKVVAATALARQRASAEKMEIEIDGELQADAALIPAVAEKKELTPSLVAGKANVLVFPDLNSGNIASKLVQYLGGAQVYGQIMLGLSKPAADLSRGATADDIVGVASIVGLQAVEYRKLYPEVASA